MNPVDQFIEIAGLSADKATIPQDIDGRIAICPVERKEYRRFVHDKTISKFSAMRSKRQAR